MSSLPCSLPVSPVLAMPTLALPGASEGDAVDDEEDIGVNPSELALDDPMVGPKPVAGKTGYLNAHADMPKIRGLPTPKTMTDAQMMEHMVSHLPYDDGCEICVAGKRNNTPHRRSSNSSSVPNISLDYGFLKDSVSDQKCHLPVSLCEALAPLLCNGCPSKWA